MKTLQSTTLLLSRQGYLKTLLALNKMSNFEMQVELFAKIVRQEIERYDVGSSTQYELHEQRVSLAQAVAKLDRAKNQYANNKESLRLVLSYDHDFELIFPEGDLDARKFFLLYLLESKTGAKYLDREIANIEKLILKGIITEKNSKFSVFTMLDLNSWERKALENQPRLTMQKVVLFPRFHFLHLMQHLEYLLRWQIL